MRADRRVAGEAAAFRYRTVWRWHFYAGLFCIPLVIWLSITGSIYLFKPQIDAWIDREVDGFALTGPSASAAAQAMAAVAAVPESTLQAYELPTASGGATRVMVVRNGEVFRVYVHPESLRILKVVAEASRFTRQISQLHGKLMAGDAGSYIVEWAASWAIVMILTGLYLWWPRDGASLAGVLYPRFHARGRLFWRDLHGVVGFWVSAFALFLLISGLPWTSFWGGNLKTLRQIGEVAVVKQDWNSGHSEHAAHPSAAVVAGTLDYAVLDRVLPSVRALQLEPPVLIVPPDRADAAWTAKSDTQNRPRRVSLTLDAQSGAVLSRKDFSDRKWLDRVIGTGVAAHEGQLFGWVNQLLGLLTALGLIALCVSAVLLWWRRRPSDTLGAPPALEGVSSLRAFRIAAALLAVLLPLMGASLVLVWLLERTLLRRIPSARAFLGLPAAQA